MFVSKGFPRPRKNIVVFQVPCRKQLGSVGRHNFFILFFIIPVPYWNTSSRTYDWQDYIIEHWACLQLLTEIQYSSRGFSVSHPSQWGRLICPLQSHSRLNSNITCNFMIFTLWSPCVSTQMGGITGGYKILTVSTQVKQGKVYRILITPLQSQSSTEILPIFSLQCFHRKWSESQRGKKF